MMRPKRMIAAALVALFAASGLGSAHGVVLCLARDGHFRVELAEKTRCSDLFSAEINTTRLVGQELKAPLSNSSHCGPCVDIPLGLGDPTKQQNLILHDSRSSIKAPVAVASGFSFAPSAGSVTQQRVPVTECLGAAALVSLRTTVLLI